MKKIVASILSIAITVLVASTIAAVAAEKKPKTIYLGSAYSGGFGKPYSGGVIGIVHARALLEEEFKKDGIKIEWFFFKGAGPATNEALANKTIDFAYIGDLPAIVGKANGLKTKFIAPGSKWTHVYISVPNDSKITTIKELKGKKVAIAKGTNAQLTFARILEANGLTEKDLKLYNLGLADGGSALKTKDIDAAVYWTDQLNLRTLGVSKIIYSTKEAPVDWRNTGGFYVTEAFAKQYPEITKRVVKAYVKAARWGSEEKNKEELFQIGVKAGTPLAAIREEFAGRSAKDINSISFDDAYVKHYVEGAVFAKERGLIRKTFDVHAWIDRSYLDEALRDLKLEGYWK
ncbi:MAG TPA: aliphatic sulfonate ABC transporter substrate-binding protein [Candidatus Deferrimicrobiaceae bacterium]|jgi:sulfonate transport system substrate-binding protein